MMTRVRACVCVSAFLLAAACRVDGRARPPPAAPPDDAPPARDAGGRCAIVGDGDLEFGGVLPLFRTRTDAEPIAMLHWLHRMRLAWSAFPRPGGDGRARVRLGGQRLARFDGWGPLSGRTFQLTARADVHAGHLWLRAGAPISIDGEAGGALVVRHAAGRFTDPEYYAHDHAVTVPCVAVVYTHAPLTTSDADARATAPPGEAVFPTGDTLHVAGSARGAILFTLRALDMGVVARWVAEDGGWVHIAGGDHLAFDGWVRAEEVTKLPRAFDREHGTEQDEVDACDVGPTTAREAPVWVGARPTGAPVLVAESGVRITPRARAGAFVAFDWPHGALAAPRGKRFWVRSADVLAPKSGAVDEDGCPVR